MTPKLRVPEPNTWREVLQTIDQHGAITHQTVLLQEYGIPNPSLVAGLEAGQLGDVVERHGDGVLDEPRDAGRTAVLDQGSDAVELAFVQGDGHLACRHTEDHPVSNRGD